MKDLKLAAVYIRVSTDEQTELSPDSQLEVVRAYAEKNGYIIPEDHIYIDPGISGRSAKNRPQFNAMIAAAKSQEHPFDAILLWKFARFARNQEESIVYKAMLRRAGVDVVSVSEPIIEGPFGSLIERIIEWMDEYYSIRLSGEVKRSMTVNAHRGVRQTAPPFGYTLGPEGGPFMVPEPTEAEIIRECFSRYAAGDAVQPLAQELAARGIRTHRGGPIENRTIMYWLQNPAYIGKNRWTPTGRTSRNFNNPDTVVVDGDHEPLVSEELFNSVQEMVRRASEIHRPKERPSFELKDWMGGVVRCADCGSTLVFSKPHYFICNGYVRARCPSRQMITVEALHEAIIEKLRADLDPAQELTFTVADTTPVGTNRKALELQASQLDRKLNRIRESYAAGIDSLEEYKRYREDVLAEQAAIREELAALDAQQDGAAAAATLRESIRSTLETIEAPDVSKERKNAAVKNIIESCTWNRATSTLSLTYRLTL